MKLALAQLNPIPGDLLGNARLILGAIERAAATGSHLFSTAELAIIGYPARDLLLRRSLVRAAEEHVDRLISAAGTIAPRMTVVIGSPRIHPGPRGLRNSAIVGRGGERIGVVDKTLLPGYDVFDEDRWFDPGTESPPILEIEGLNTGVLICEDLWRGADAGTPVDYQGDPPGMLIARGADFVLALNASPFVRAKHQLHVDRLADVAASGVTVAAVNQVGGFDDLVFDGRSLVVGPNGNVIARGSAFDEDLIECEIPSEDNTGNPASDDASDFPEIWPALVLGLRDYVRKTGHSKAIIGLSGGIDSALVAVIAVAALGPDAVSGILMPSRYSSDGSVSDADTLARRLGIASHVIAIEPAHAVMREILVPTLGEVDGVTDENLQARIRGQILMAAANANHAFVLSTSNKSELAVGYSTLYGDMCGAISPIGDLLKGDVYDFARWVNEHHESLGFTEAPIPTDSITKPPSAELRPDQTDQDSLPDYDVLDQIVAGVIEHDETANDIIARTGLDEALVRHWVRLIDIMEYKRFQGSIILKVSRRTFGRGRPMPLVMRTETGA